MVEVIQILNKRGLQYAIDKYNIKCTELPHKNVYLIQSEYDQNLILRKEDNKWYLLSTTSTNTIKYSPSGILLHITYFDDKWHIFTKDGDADLQYLDDKKMTYGDYLRKHIRDFSHLDELCIYIFEIHNERLVLVNVIDKQSGEIVPVWMQNKIADIYDIMRL